MSINFELQYVKNQGSHVISTFFDGLVNGGQRVQLLPVLSHCFDKSKIVSATMIRTIILLKSDVSVLTRMLISTNLFHVFCF